MAHIESLLSYYSNVCLFFFENFLYRVIVNKFLRRLSGVKGKNIAPGDSRNKLDVS